ncbi:FkbM family methyltransferase [Novosphingobium album (ex Hu et al. 2023)]|uniref:FkbM family methyltransferase n=1 Tax=Novosphingobium album (ex Hu et al. 2023) TaxID=2930093 RepID=A0ABT0AZF2_9SPHN|nr:FkbM family methyltransferase [Novosphingobium album (ex Hu et al. 2023)]MCJ2178174.1 FkbM family methyltransferase [Novosphingobium album (ex Hu et al. 2023)]
MSREADLSCALTSGRYALIGAGQLGAMSLAMWPHDVPRPEFCLDSYKTGDLEGIVIEPLAGHVRRPGVTYLLSAFKMPAEEIRAIFARIGQPDVITVYDFFEQYTPALFSNGWRNLAPSAGEQERAAGLAACFADDLSREACAAACAWRFHRELVDGYPVGSEDSKYDLSLFGRGGCHYDLIYDGGAYDLGLLKYLTGAGVTWDRIVAFEPDPGSAAICLEQIPAWEAKGGAPVALDRRALSDHAGTGRFLANGLLSSRLIEDESIDLPDMVEVETVRLDEIGHGEAERVLLKLHIEGSELPALRGAEHLLRTRAVDVLVNLSHDQRSLLEIPGFLAGLDRHDLFLRSHALFGEGLTLFARYRG